MARETDRSPMTALPKAGLVCSLIAGAIGLTRVVGLVGAIVSISTAVGMLGARYKSPRSVWLSLRVLVDIVIVGVLIVLMKIRKKVSSFVIQRN